MSKHTVKFCAVRILQVQQVEMWHDIDGENPIGNRIPSDAFLADELPPNFISYTYIEIVSKGWSAGARTRIKKLFPDRALPFVNKLHAGGWINDEQYNLMYTATDALLRKHCLGPWAWEVPGFDFSSLIQ